MEENHEKFSDINTLMNTIGAIHDSAVFWLNDNKVPYSNPFLRSVSISLLGYNGLILKPSLYYPYALAYP